MKPLAVLSLACLFLLSCGEKKKADLLVYNATIYLVDSAFSTAGAMAIRDGLVLAVGDYEDLLDDYEAGESLDAGGGIVYPGFIDAHAHFLSYGLGLQTVDLTGTRSWNHVMEKLHFFSKQHPEGWITGRGWDQNDWVIKTYPTKEKLDLLFPDRPVLLLRVDGHAAIANQKALDTAGIKPGDLVTGGEIVQEDGKLTGLLIDNAIDLVRGKIPPPAAELKARALIEAERNCLAAGLTTIDDCGLDFEDVLFIDSLQKAGVLKMRLYVLLSDVKKNIDFLLDKGQIKTSRLNVRGFKIYADGSLGSRGACLLEPYADRPEHYGFLLSRPAHFDSVAELLARHRFQMCTHAIGDSGNRTILNIYAKHLKEKNDLRWRIEHAQVVHEADLDLFGTYQIIPSVQPTHATSDMYWAKDRLGAEREKDAYAYKKLLRQNGWLPLGTDFPVEDISPVKTYVAAVFRQDARQFPGGGYRPEERLTPQEALRGMTIWAARANFEEGEKGSLEPGKLADFVILDRDILKARTVAEALQARVLMTYIQGEKLFELRP